MNEKVDRPHASGWLRDKLLMFAAALCIIVLGLTAFWYADEYHIDFSWILAAIISLSFFPTIGWDYRQHFKSPSFLSFFVIWMVLHGLIFFELMSRFGWGGWIPAVPIELLLFYLSASLIFRLRVPSTKNEGED